MPAWSRSVADMEKPAPLEHHRYVGDKRTQVVYDVDELDPEDAHLIDELMASEQFASFGPDVLPEARNRGYHPCRRCAERADTAP